MRHSTKIISLLAFITTYVSAQTCSQYGSASDSTCLCPPGFNPSSGSTDCTLPVCGGSLYQPGPAAPGGTGGFGNVTLDSTCGCSSGWAGPGCTVCNSASACTNSLTRFLNSSNSLSTGLNNTMTCSNIPTAFASSEMSCNVVTPLLQSLFPLRSTLTITRTLNASLSPGGSNALTSSRLVGGDGVVYAQLWYEGVEQFYCRAGSCTQTVASSGGGSVNGSTWVCPDLACTCRPNTDFCGRTPATNLTGAINVLQGPLTIDCSGTDIGTCGFNSPFLQNLFGASGIQLSSCQFGECVQQYVVDQALDITTASGSNDSGLSGGVIAGLAVVGVLLLAVIVMVIWSFITQRKARRNMITDGTLPKSGGVGIRWTGVTYEVKTARHTWTRVVAWAKGSGGVSRATSTEGGDHLGVGGGKIVLRDSCGSIPAGGFCCILGPSGAGKSTLVDVLAGKRKAGRVEGNVAFNKADGHGNIKIGYVDQSDILAPTSTVLETLVFAAKLRLPESVPIHLKEERAQEVIRQLNLEHVANTRVGSSEHRGISGGEMRRVSIGVELVAAPDVLVLDEPTSGLDSVSASRLIKLLKDLTQGDSRTTIVASIHQPSSALYHAFDQVLLLSTGRQLYFGPGGTAPVEYFDKQGRPCPTGYNIADHLLEIASAPTDGLPTGSNAVGTPSQATSTSDRSSRSSDVIEAHSKSDLARQHTADQSDTPFAEKGIGSTSYPPQTLLKDESTNGNGFSASSTQSGSQASGGSKWWPSSNCSTTFLTQLEVLSGREWRNLKRDKTLLVAHIFFACLLGVFAGGLYYKVSLTIAGFQNRVGSMFFLGTLIAFSSLSALHNLNEVRGLFLRERAGSVYSPQAWLLSRVLFDVVPLRLIPTILVGIIVYFMVGLAREADRFFKFLLILVEYSLGMTLYNFFLAALVRNGGVAILLSSLWNLFLMTYAGFFVNIGNIPPVLRWLRYFSTLGYALEAMSVNEVGSGLQIIDTLGGVPIEINAAIIMDTLFGFDLGNYYRDVLVLFAFIAGFAILLIGTVVYVLRERR